MKGQNIMETKMINNAILLSTRHLEDLFDDDERNECEFDPIGLFVTHESLMHRVYRNAEKRKNQLDVDSFEVDDSGDGFIVVTYPDSYESDEYIYEPLGPMEVEF